MAESPPDRIRVAALQYFLRPVRTFEEFQAQVEGLVDTAADDKCRLIVTECFTVRLLTLGGLKRPIHRQGRDLAGQTQRCVDLFQRLKRKTGLYIVAGSIPSLTGDDGWVRACARLRGCHRDAAATSADRYALAVVRGEIGGPTLSFRLKRGFEVLAIVPGYLRRDPDSLGYAAVGEWLHPEGARAEDYGRGDPKFRRHYRAHFG